jgi:hypothetical protein
MDALGAVNRAQRFGLGRNPIRSSQREKGRAVIEQGTGNGTSQKAAGAGEENSLAGQRKQRGGSQSAGAWVHHAVRPPSQIKLWPVM